MSRLKALMTKVVVVDDMASRIVCFATLDSTNDPVCGHFLKMLQLDAHSWCTWS